MFFISDWYILPAAFLLDYLLGDPTVLPHPIRWMGKGITVLEPWFRQRIAKTVHAGWAFALFLIAGVWLATTLLMAVANAVHPVVGKVVEIVILYYSISTFQLKKEARSVLDALFSEGLVVAKQRLSRIVGRDVAPLDEVGVMKATLETVAENLVDGVVSPLFWAGVGGAPFAMAYKMINTLDSMVGYKNDTYLDFGRASAKIDDAANWIPARLSVLITAVAAFFLKCDWKGTFSTGMRDGRNHTSPNSGYPEASFAGALHVCLGGSSTYGGVRVDKPLIGAEFGPVDADALGRAMALMVAASGLSVFMSMTLAHIIHMLA